MRNAPGMNNRHGHHQHYSKEQLTVNDLSQTLKQLWHYLVKKRIQLFMVFLFTIVTTVVSIVGTRLNGIIIDQYISSDRLRMLTIICSIMVGMYLFSSIFNWLQNHFMVLISQDTSAAIRHDIFSNMQRLPLTYFDHHPSGDLMSRMTNDVDNINTALMQTFIQLFTGIITVIGMLIAMLIVSPMLTVVVLVASLGTYVFSRAIARATQSSFIHQQEELGILNSEIEETLSGKKTIQLFERTDQILSEFKATNQRYVDHAYRAQFFSGTMGPLNNMVNNLAYAAITIIGAIAIIKGYSGITVGVIFSFLIYLRDFNGPIRNMLDLINTLQLSIASAERVFEVVNATPEPDEEQLPPTASINGEVVLKHVSFGYEPGVNILKDLSLTAKPGETVAIVGPTGAGKTTTINLLTKLYPLNAGTITIDGVNIDQIRRQDLRRNIAIVQQEPFLFSMTVKENILLGRPNATDADVVTAAKAANADSFIRLLPQGYDTLLTDGAQNLSQGQRQLLSIARAFIAQTPLLILDEATSSIDTKTELDIQEATTQLMQDKTSFVIAHRLSTIQNADQIIVVNHGEIVERGTHENLLAANGFYAALYNSQFSNLQS